MKALVLCLLALVASYAVTHRKPPKPSGPWSGYSGGHWMDCTQEGFDAYERAHPNGGGV